jgi:hypothetical protein
MPYHLDTTRHPGNADACESEAGSHEFQPAEDRLAGL